MTDTKRDASKVEFEDLDRTIFNLSGEQARQFMEALINPPAPNKALRQAMAKSAPWDAEETSACDG